MGKLTIWSIKLTIFSRTDNIYSKFWCFPQIYSFLIRNLFGKNTFCGTDGDSYLCILWKDHCSCTEYWREAKTFWKCITRKQCEEPKSSGNETLASLHYWEHPPHTDPPPSCLPPKAAKFFGVPIKKVAQNPLFNTPLVVWPILKLGGFESYIPWWLSARRLKD